MAFKQRLVQNFQGDRSLSFSPSRKFSQKFSLPNEFVDMYRTRPVNFGFNGLGEIAYIRTYSRLKQDGTNEQWADTVERIVNGGFKMQQRFSNGKFDKDLNLPIAMQMYDKIFNFKFLPPGRGLWAMGSLITEETQMYTALNNGAFVSTELLKGKSVTEPFTFLMESSMLGVGVGFDTKGANQIKVYHPDKSRFEMHTIDDSREGWVESVKRLLDSYFSPDKPTVKFNYTKIRK